MIAPIEKAKPRASAPGIRRARRMVASTLLKPPPPGGAPRLPAWRAWLFTAWVVVVVAVYLVCMAGLF